jgi:IS5 family transposase
MKRYRIKNWPQYNKSLIQRGSINFWFSEDSIRKWKSTSHTGEKGRPVEYSDDAILCALLIRTVYHLPLRATEGLLLSLVSLLDIPLKIPSYTQICRRAKFLGKTLKKLSSRRPHDIVFDSTGLKVYGEGEWKVKQHGTSKRRTWRKLHLGVDPDSKEIIVAEVTSNSIGSGDSQIGKKLLKKAPKSAKRIFGDGAYDGTEFRQEIEKNGAEPIIPPPRDAIVHRESVDKAMQKRNDAVKEIHGLGGDDEARRIWKILKGYHRRSLAETAMYRIKQLTGGNMRSREWERQRVEGYIKCLVINKMTTLGMPDSVWEAVA